MGHKTVVVGGGIVGAFCAYELARSGHDVTILDPNPGSGASTGNAGLLVPSYCLPMANPATLLLGVKALTGTSDGVSVARPMSRELIGWAAGFAWASRPGRAMRAAPELVSMAARSIAAYEDVAERDGLALEIRRRGWLHVAESESALHSHQKGAQGLRRLGVQTLFLSSSETRDMVPQLTTNVAGGIYFPDDAALDPTVACQVVLDAAGKYGAQIVRASAVGLIRSATGRASAVCTTQGNIPSHSVVLAAGSRTPAVARLFGLRPPRIIAAKGWSLTLPAHELSTPEVALMSIEDHVVVNATSSVIRLTGGMEIGGDPVSAPAAAEFAHLRRTANRLLPALASLDREGERYWGARPMTGSGLPITRRYLDNLVVAAGHGTLGMTLAPATAQLVERTLRPPSRRSTR